MKSFVSPAILASLIVSATPLRAADSYSSYTNARFGYRIRYPSNLVTPAPETGGGSARKFRSRDGKVVLTTYGARNVNGRSLRAEMLRAARAWRADGSRVTLQRTTSKWFVISGFVGQDIFYEKTVLHQGAFCTMIWEYPRALRSRLDAPVTRAFASFAPQNFVRVSQTRASAKPQQTPSPRTATPVVTRPVVTRPVVTRPVATRSAPVSRPVPRVEIIVEPTAVPRFQTPARSGY